MGAPIKLFISFPAPGKFTLLLGESPNLRGLIVSALEVRHLILFDKLRQGMTYSVNNSQIIHILGVQPILYFKKPSIPLVSHFTLERDEDDACRS